ncbi:MAG TPA: hypothetical protein VH251_01185, partial [Verrucomicrobiae bacterium]|nr:hypothetical protein [Verrucomicrobiae bacterium]
MKTKQFVFQVTVIVLLAIFLRAHNAQAQGLLTPPAGVPGPTMKSLAQIEPRTAISTAPYTINAPGSYYLTTNLSVNVSNAITIAVGNVTLDLNGFTIASTTPSPVGTAVLIANSQTNIAIFNGSIASGVSETGGVYSGRGFDSGIEFALNLNSPPNYGQPVNVRVSHVSVSGCLTYGIFLGGLSTLVEYCTVQTVGSYGLEAAKIQNSVAGDCGDTAIDSIEVSDCHGQSIGSGAGINASIVENCYGSSTNGYGLSATTVQNCEGVSVNLGGIFAQQAVNCQGSSSASTYDGIYAVNAQNCTGYNTTGTGIRATSTAINCYGQGNTDGIEVDGVAENCNGRASTNGIGLIASSASNCSGYCSAGNSGVGL